MRRRLIAPLGLGLILFLALLAGWSAGQTQAAPSLTPAAAPRVALPAIDVGGDWTSQLSLQNLGSANSFAVLELYPQSAGACPGGGPAFRVCLGELAPGQARTVNIVGLPAGAYSGYLVAYTACPDSGGAPGTTPLAAVVSRQINIAGTPPRTAASAYTGLTPDLSAYNPDTDRYTYYAPHIRANVMVDTTTLALQNVGTECATVKVSFYDESFQDNQNCLGLAGTVTATIAPGGAVRITPDQADLPVFFGNAVIEASRPLAVTVDVAVTGNRQLLTYTALSYAPGEPRFILPFVISMPINPAAWLTTLKVQNTSPLNPSIVTERLYSRDGSPASASVSQNICPASSRLLPVLDFGSSPDLLGSADVQNGAAMALLTNTGLEQFDGYAGIPPTDAAARLGLPRLRRVVTNGVMTLRSQIVARNVDPFATIDVALTLYDDEGHVLDTETDTVEGNGAAVFDLAGLNYLGTNWRGSGILTARGGTNPRIVAVVLERGGETGSDTSRTYVAARIGPSAVTPAPSRTPTATPPPPPSATPEISPTPSLTPTPTATPQPTVVALTPAPNAAGYVVSLNPNTNYLTAGEIYVGSDKRPLKPIQWIGAVQFDVSSVPDTADLIGAEVMLTGKNAVYLDGAQGIRWEVQLLDKSADEGWTTITYNRVIQAAVVDHLTPSLTRDDLGVGVVNTFTFTPEGLAALRERLRTTNRVSLRIVATEPSSGYRAIFTWESGNSTGAEGRKPLLRLTYR
ncbi:MAG: hypothetical protein KIT87_04055 [Anaerolineae bacterium]|nr:hypothetical protein [Anaerolineae bacterium]